MELIYKKKPLEKIAGTKVPDDTKKWPETIVKEVNKQAPFLASLVSHVSMEKTEPESGYAVGNIVIKSGEKKSLLPFTIRDFHLDPIDVFIASGEYYPLSETTFNRIHFDPGIANTKGKSKDSDDFSASAGSQDIDDIKDVPKFLEKSSSIIDAIKDTITKRDLDKFREEIVKVSSVYDFHNNPAMAVVEKILSIEGKDRTGPIEKIAGIINSDLIRIKREECGTYTIESTPRNYYHPRIQEGLDKEAAIDAVKQANPAVNADQAVNQAKSQGESISSPKQSSPAMAQEDIPNAAMGGGTPIPFGYYMCQTQDGNIVKGWIIPQTYDFNMNETGQMLFTNGEVSSLQPQIAAQPAEPEMEIPESDLSGGMAAFFAQDGSAALSTVPFQIVSTIQNEQGTSVRGIGIDGNKLNFIPTQGINSIIQIGLGDMQDQSGQEGMMITDGANYYVPTEMQVIKIGAMAPLLSDEDMMQKMSMPMLFNTVRVISLGSNEFALKGAPIEKLASIRGENPERLGFNDARWYLVVSGLSKEASESFLNRAEQSFRKEVTAIGPKKIVTIGDMAMDIDLDYDPIHKLAESIRSIRCNLVKEAASISNDQVADKILSLNFISPENLQIFVEYLEEFRNVAKKLSKLLLASRIGLTAVDEKNVKSAMEKLDGVIAQLESIKKSL